MLICGGRMDNLSLCFHHVGPGTRTQVVRIGGQYCCIYMQHCGWGSSVLTVICDVRHIQLELVMKNLPISSQNSGRAVQFMRSIHCKPCLRGWKGGGSSQDLGRDRSNQRKLLSIEFGILSQEFNTEAKSLLSKAWVLAQTFGVTSKQNLVTRWRLIQAEHLTAIY